MPIEATVQKGFNRQPQRVQRARVSTYVSSNCGEVRPEAMDRAGVGPSEGGRIEGIPSGDA